MDHVISESCYKGPILQRNSGKNDQSMSISYNSYVKFYAKKNLGAKTLYSNFKATVLYPNPSYNKVCYKGTAPFIV